MTIRLLWIIVLAATTSACVNWRPPPRFGDLLAQERALRFQHDIRLYTLKNGMSVALLPDRRTNLVTVDARYRVGFSEDPSGRAGLAHLVEHLTFEARTGADRATLGDRLGEAALQYNAFTNHDVTHYTAITLANRLADVLELEAQRLEMTCAQLDEGIFSRERDVVLEEVAERRTPWSDLQLELSRTLWGQDHPYARGNHEVAEVTRDEACRFFDSYYAPDRLTLVVTGDFDPDRIAYAIGKRFSEITRQSSAERTAVQAAGLTGTRSRHQADVDQAVALVFFPAPSWGSKDAVLHELALSRLRQVLAQADRRHSWIRDVSVSTLGAGRAQLLRVAITVDAPERLGSAVEELFSRAPSMFEDVGPYQGANLLGRLQTGYMTSYESFTDRGAWLADYLTYTQHNGFMVPELETLASTTMVEADRYARTRFVPEKSHIALIEPSGKVVAAAQGGVASGREPDLAPWRAPVDRLEAQRPIPAPTMRARSKADEMILANGLRVLLAPDPSSALIDARLVFPHGSASDPRDRRGLASAAAHLLEPDSGRRYHIADALMLEWGMSVGTQHDLEVHETSTVFKIRGSANKADWHVWRLQWIIDQWVYRSYSVDIFREDAVQASAEDEDPAGALSLQLLFGAEHPYAIRGPADDDWSWLTWEELERYRAAYYVPRGATLIVSGGFELEPMREHIRTLFEPWADAAVAPPVLVPVAQPTPGPSWVGTRDPSRTQVELMVAFATSSAPDREQAARLVLREMITDRLRIVREGMGASYGVEVSYAAGSGGGLLYASSALEPSRAAKAAKAIVSEFEALRTGAGAMAEEFVRARRRALAAVLADAAGVTAVADELEYAVRRGLPLNHFDQLALAISKVTPAEVAAVAAADLDRRRMVVSVTASPGRLDEVMTGLGATQPVLFDEQKTRR
jgi:zinc protease